MTALAVAIVLCCAMVCGTRLALRRMADNQRTALASADARTALARADAAIGILNDAGRELAQLRQDIDALKAQSAFRSLG